MSQEASKMEVVGEVSAPMNTTVHSSGQKRIGLTGVLPRRGGRKKTLSLNPEEREALENLIEEVIIDGGMGDSESASSDEEDSSHDGASKEKSDTPNVVTGENSNDPKVAASFKVSKKFYPGQLKVALKHMTDLPPRFSRKLKRAEKYLEMTATQKKTSVSTSIKEEEEEEIVNFNLAPHPTNSIQDSRAISPKQFQNDKVKIQKEKTQKDLKKTIRSLLTDLDQYVDEKERVSISMDLPGAVSCADLERETLAYSTKSSESAAMPQSSPDAEPSNSKAKITGISNLTTTESSSVDRQKCPPVSTKSSTHLVNQFNQPSTSKNYSSLPSPSVYNVPPGSSASKISGNAMMNTKQLALVDKNPLSPQYSNMAPTSYIDGNSIMMPVQPLMPQMPQIDFSVPPPSTFQFSPQYGIPSSQESYMSGDVQYQTQYGYVELPAAGTAPSHAGINFVDTAPIIFQQFNTLPIASQHQQVSPLPYAGSPGYFLGRFGCQGQPLNYIPQFQTSSSSLMNADSVYKTSVERNPQKQRCGNPNVGNFRAPLKSKSNSNSQSPNVDSMGSKIRPRNFQNYNKQDPMKQHVVAHGRDVTSLGSFSTPPDLKTNQSNSIPHLHVTIVDETLNVPKVVFKINQNPSPPTTSSPINPPTRPPSTTNGRSSDCSTDSGVKTGSTTSDDLISDHHNTTGQSFKSTDDDSRTSVDEFLAADIDLGTSAKNDDVEDDGDAGLDVVLGESFVKKLNEMFIKSNESADNHYTSKPVFLSSKVLKEIFRTIASPSSPPS